MRLHIILFSIFLLSTSASHYEWVQSREKTGYDTYTTVMDNETVFGK